MDAIQKYIRVDDPWALSYAASVLVSGFLLLQCVTPPNKTPSKSWRSDGLAFYGNSVFMTLVSALVMSQVVHHALIAASTPAGLRLACPNPALLNESLFRWTPLTAACFVVILVFAPLRLGAYRNLGTNFTYGLAAPNRLITDGIYSYVQHPSYTGLLAVGAASALQFGRWDTGVGCLLPEQVVERIVQTPHLSIAVHGVILLVAASQLYTRVSQEEAMLKELFGKEWVRWHAKTARFVPGIL